MSPHQPPPMDAPEADWRAYISNQLAHLHECLESKQGETEERVEVYHAENQQAVANAQKRVLAAVEELKQEVQVSASWISDEEKKRQAAALVEQGRQQERKRWIGWLSVVEEWGQKGLDLGIKVGLGAGVFKVGQMLGAW